MPGRRRGPENNAARTGMLIRRLGQQLAGFGLLIENGGKPDHTR
jgi:hypothetical protein